MSSLSGMTAPSSTTAPRRNPAGRKLVVAGLVALATFVLVLGDVAIWARRVLLDTDEWVESAELVLENDAVQAAVAEYLIDEVDTLVDLESVSMGALPDGADELAGAASEASRVWIRSVVPQILESQQFRVAWLGVNERAHATFVAIVRNDNSTMLASVNGDEVVIDLGAALEELREISIDSGGTFLRGVEIPDDLGEFTLFDDSQVGVVGDGINALDSLAPVLLIVAVGLYVAAILVSRVKWKTMIVVGASALGVAVLVWVLLVAGRSIVGGSIAEERPAAAAEALWDIATRDLRTQSIVLGVLGAGVLGVGLALGPFAWSENLRARRGRSGGVTEPADPTLLAPAPAGGATPSRDPLPPTPPSTPPSVPPSAPPSGRPSGPPPRPASPPPGPPPGPPPASPPETRRPPPAYPPGR